MGQTGHSCPRGPVPPWGVSKTGPQGPGQSRQQGEHWAKVGAPAHAGSHWLRRRFHLAGWRLWALFWVLAKWGKLEWLLAVKEWGRRGPRSSSRQHPGLESQLLRSLPSGCTSGEAAVAFSAQNVRSPTSVSSFNELLIITASQAFGVHRKM